MNKKRKELIQNNKISMVKSYNLNGYQQKVAIEGLECNNPILITLHGGPGTPIPFSVGSRGLFAEFTEKFIMVYWDQLGCGINNYNLDDSFNIETFVSMTVTLIREIKKDFPLNKIFLFGMSWGSVLAAIASSRIPEYIDGVLVYGQVVKELFFNDEVYDAIKKSGISSKDTLKLVDIKSRENHSPDDIKHMATFIRKYTKGYTAKTDEKTQIISFIIGLLTSPDYKFKDFLAVFKNGYLNNSSIWQELINIDLTENIKGSKVPYIIIQGDKDLVTPTSKVVELISTMENDNVYCKVVKNCGHLPNADGMARVLEEVSNLNN